MKKLINTIIAVSVLTVTAIAQTSVSVSAGWREKGIEFGKVVDETGAYVAGIDATWQSFRFGVSTENHGSLSDINLYKVNFLVGYKFFSTLADVEIGTGYSMKNHPGKYDLNDHAKPFVTVSKGPFSLSGRMDLESKLSNVEGTFTKGFKVGPFDVSVPVFIGYTDTNDYFPKSAKEIKFTNLYYGGKVVGSWKIFHAGVVALYCGENSKTTIGWEAGLSHKF